MTTFPESDLAQLRDRFPERDVDRIAAAVAAKHAKTPFANPVAMLTSWCKTAEARDTDRRDAKARPAVEYQPAPMGERSDPAYAAFRFDLVRRILSEGLKPDDVAKILNDNLDQFPQVASLMHAEANDLGALGPDWRPMLEPAFSVRETEMDGGAF